MSVSFIMSILAHALTVLTMLKVFKLMKQGIPQEKILSLLKIAEALSIFAILATLFILILLEKLNDGSSQVITAWVFSLIACRSLTQHVKIAYRPKKMRN